VELLAQGARFYELLGYALTMLAVGILGAGVTWSLRSRVPQKRRAFFLVTAFAALTTVCGGILLVLVLSQPLSPQPLNLSMPRPKQRDRASVGEDDTDGVLMIQVYVEPDGTVLFQGERLAVEQLVPHLRRKYGKRRLTITIRADPELPVGVVQPVIRHVQQHGVFRFTLELHD